MEDKIIYSVYAESNPNPAAMKFVANRFLLPNGSLEMNSVEEAQQSPLAAALFRFPFVKAVFITSNFVTVIKNDMVPWDEVVLELREFIRDHLNSGGGVVKEGVHLTEPDLSEPPRMAHAEATTDVEQRIIDILDEYVRPAVEGDGGHISFQSYAEGRVNVLLQGACSGCPSSTYTLKAGIEGLLKKMLPGEVDEVVAVNG
jgi:Fe-S cluster biogenesis protein NfuA